MKIRKIVDVNIDVESLATIMVHSEDQAKFFNKLALEFKSFADGDKDGMQMLYIKDDLNDDAKQFIAKLNEYVNSD